MPSRVLIDAHHAGLFHSLQLLFEDRLGLMVYRPLGHEWWSEHYWEFGKGYGDDRLAQQFLSTDGWQRRDGYWESRDPHYPDRPIFGIELGVLRNHPQDWRHIVCTVQDNQPGFSRLAHELRDHNASHVDWDGSSPSYVLQVGNINQDVDWKLDPIALISSEAVPRNKSVVYHQEFDSEGLFGFSPPGQGIVSMVNCFSSTYCARWWQEAQALLDVPFAEHGIDGAQGNIEPIAEQARIMRNAGWGWHDKVQGDGFGHVIHAWAALGRPLIGHGMHYRGLMAAPFWEDGVTCIDLDRHSVPEAVEIIRSISPERHAQMGRAIRARFDELVDWAAEAQSIRDIL